MISAEKRVLVADNNAASRQSWRELLGAWGFTVLLAADGQEALELATSQEPHILISEVAMPGLDGLGLLREIRERGLALVPIIVSAQGEIHDAVAAIKLGAREYLCQPIDHDRLCHLLEHLSEHLEVGLENARLRSQLLGIGELGPIIGQSLAMRRVMSLIEQVAPSRASIVISGESGTGKDLAAHCIHELSPRRQAPYLAINCAALPEALVESELFGHEKGAFTGAERRREGCFELANGGTLLLDEITEMKPELQAKLLRAIEERRVRRVGGSTELSLDVRVLAASNRPLERALREGRLREDLYYRLSVFSLELPPLRERPEDIDALVEATLREFQAQAHHPIRGVSHECLQVLRAYTWPGNVRQLRNVIERAVIVSRAPVLEVADLPPELQPAAAPNSHLQVTLGSSLAEVERQLITRTIEFVGGNKTRAAEVLGVSLKTLYNRLDRRERREGPEAGGGSTS
jgi:DNA-binding NtrC family response regulator